MHLPLAFKTTKMESIQLTVNMHIIELLIVRWITSMFDDRLIIANISGNNFMAKRIPGTGRPFLCGFLS